MLGSDFDGERATAALKADTLRRECGVEWDSLLINIGGRTAGATHQAYSPQPKPIPPIFAELAKMHAQLSEWERAFVADVTDRVRHGARLTDRQTAKINQIFEKHKSRAA